MMVSYSGPLLDKELLMHKDAMDISKPFFLKQNNSTVKTNAMWHIVLRNGKIHNSDSSLIFQYLSPCLSILLFTFSFFGSMLQVLGSFEQLPLGQRVAPRSQQEAAQLVPRPQDTFTVAKLEKQQVLLTVSLLKLMVFS